MAEAAVDFLLNNLKHLLLYHSNLITQNKKQIERLEMDLRMFLPLLKDPVNNEIMNAVDRNIREVVYEVEDEIDAFVAQAMEKRPTSSCFKFRKPSVNSHRVGLKVEEMLHMVERAKTDILSLKVNDELKSETPQTMPPRQIDVVGFEDVTEELIHRLTRETNYIDVVSLIGMHGMGKTTLAWKIFNDPKILYQFPVRIWLSISQEFSYRDIFLAILKEFTYITDDIRQRDDMEIARIVVECLETTRFMIVMDDVWSCADWDRLKYALPSYNIKGKVLITSRIEDVGRYASNPRPSYKLRFLTDEESWELLLLGALGKRECPPELVSVSKIIASVCMGLPVAIVIMGGILATRYSDLDLSATRRAWEEVSEKVSAYLYEDSENLMNRFIALSYDKLPYHLRPCFLYLGMFPDGYDIPASKLILMWIGEGFIQQSSDSSLEETGEKYLNDLINRNLVTVEKFKHDGKVKTCRIQRTLHDFVQNEAKYVNIHQEIKFNNGVFAPPVSDVEKYRRLSLHSNCLKFFSSKPVGSHVRSFVCFSKDKCILPSENIPDILKAFKLLRVLDVKPLTFSYVNSDLYQLVHVRYISISFDRSALPSKFSQLWNLQTLIVDTTSRTLEVKADIWKLIQLRHFETNARATLPKPSRHSKHGAELQTLGTISVESCTAELSEQASNLKKLVISGKLALLLEGKKGYSHFLGRMKFLENLKLINDVFPMPPSEGQLNRLLQPHQFPSRLKSLTLRGTYLDWSNMSVLGLLENLEVLKLKDRSFVGKTWETMDGDFPRLEILLIADTDLEVWTASSHHYPRLRRLVLRNCERLCAVPTGLADIPSFQMLELFSSRSAVASARKFQQAKEKAQAIGSAFELSIFPPVD